MTMERLRNLVSSLSVSSNALIALGAALDAHLSSKPVDAGVQARLADVLSALGVPDLLENASAAELRPVLAGIKTDVFLAAKLLANGAGSEGWAHGEADILQAAGDVSAGFPAVFKSRILPRLEGLQERLDADDAAFLDVGAGVTALSIAMAGQWPSLRVVAIEPWPPSVAIARERVKAAGLVTRIELRQQAGEDVVDREAFDLIWIPSAFIPERVIRGVAERAMRALRPGGWTLLAALAPSDDILTMALTRLRAALWDGCLFAPGEAEKLLADVGLSDVQTLPGPPGSVVAMFAGRKNRA